MSAMSVWPEGRYGYRASADVQPGQVVVRPCGTLAVHDNPDTIKNGAFFNPAPLKGIMRFASASATTAAVGAAVYITIATQLVSGTASGNVYVGRLTEAKTAGQTSVIVNTEAPA
jgi:hypothetical protein